MLNTDFYSIPNFSKYKINKNGIVINIEKDTILKGSVNPAGYHNFRLTRDDGYVFTWGRHRLMGYVFKPIDGDISTMYVNHLNGIKGDDRLENLEWVTPKENVEHAGLNDLTDKCNPVSIRHVVTNEILKFNSCLECAKFLNVSKDTILWRVRRGQEKVYPDGYRLKLGHDDSEWNDNVELAYGNHKGIQIKFLKTDVILEFQKRSQAAMYLNMQEATLKKWLKMKNQFVFPGLIQVKEPFPHIPWNDVDDPYLELENGGWSKPVIVLNEDMSYFKIFESAVECAEYFKIKTTTLDYRLKTNGQRIFSDNKRYCYYSVFKTKHVDFSPLQG